MQRYFVPSDQMNDDTVFIQGEDVNHMVKVMRFRAGEQVICCNGKGRDVLAEIAEITPNQVELKIVVELDDSRELPLQVTIAQGLPKGDKMDYIIQKGTELGAFSFWPFTSRYTVVKLDEKKEKKRVERWGKIAKEAAEQSHRSAVPTISRPLGWRELLAKAGSFDYALFAYEKEVETPFSQALQGIPKGSSVLLLIGPEGGFSEDEVREAEETGMKRVSLGRRILRTETASLYGLSCISYQFERE